LLLADGYYEWLTEGKLKQPFVYEMSDGKPFAFVGLWESWRDPSKPDAPPFESCSIVTTDANELAREVQDRMPVILPPESYDAWLSAETDPAALQFLLVPFPAERMTSRPVNRYVNNVRNHGPECLGPPC
jgi:putative SOS response-associated peptidase YedK